jgi:hypothetical protein
MQRFRWCRRGESNPRPRDYETLALPLSYAGIGQFFMLRSNAQECQAQVNNTGKSAYLRQFSESQSARPKQSLAAYCQLILDDRSASLRHAADATACHRVDERTFSGTSDLA